MVEMMIVVGLIGIMGSVAALSLRSYYVRKQASTCANNIHQLFIVVHDYAIDQQVKVGGTVNLYRLAPNYIRSADNFKCPTCKLHYGTNFIYGRIPICPGNITNHVWKQTDSPNL